MNLNCWAPNGQLSPFSTFLLKCETEHIVCLCKEDLLHILICRNFTVAARRSCMHDAARSNWCVQRVSMQLHKFILMTSYSWEKWMRLLSKLLWLHLNKVEKPCACFFDWKLLTNWSRVRFSSYVRFTWQEFRSSRILLKRHQWGLF